MQSMKNIESDLINRCLENDQAALEQLFRNLEPSARKIARFIFSNGSEADIEDAVQNSLLKIFTNLKKFKKESTLHTYLYTIIRNEIWTLQRSWWQRLLQSSRPIEDSYLGQVFLSPDKKINKKQAYETLVDLFGVLRQRQREALVYRYVLEYTVKELSETIGISENAAKKRIRRGLNKIYSIIKNNSDLCETLKEIGNRELGL